MSNLEQPPKPTLSTHLIYTSPSPSPSSVPSERKLDSDLKDAVHTPSEVHILTSLLTPTECTSIIDAHLDLVPSNVTAQTVRSREVFVDEELAGRVWERMEGFFESRGEEEGVMTGREKVKGWVRDEDGEEWRVKGLNEVWRLCCYDVGGKFSPHQDGRRLESINLQSFMTLNIYLSTNPLEAGGATRFYSTSPYSSASSSSPQETVKPIFSSQPLLGSAAMFRDDIWHDGEELRAGRKYLLRTDVMFERIEEWSEERVWKGLSGEEKGRRALRIAEGLEDAGKGGEAVGWYRKAFRMAPELEKEG